MCGLPFARPLSSFVRYTAHSHTDRALPGHLAQNRGREPHHICDSWFSRPLPHLAGLFCIRMTAYNSQLSNAQVA
nr:MAG TPA: hypothetical protein [Bacteriophage sp.]